MYMLLHFEYFKNEIEILLHFEYFKNVIENT